MPLWAQVPGTDPNAIPALALQRWFAGVTLCSPESGPSRFGLTAWLAALGVLLVVAILVQGPKRALRQLVDVPGHLRVAGAAARRVRRATWLVAILLGAAVVAWTGWQAIGHARAENLDSLAILRKNKTTVELGLEQGALAALTPLRDLTALGDWLLLLLAAGLLVFKLSADRWGGAPRSWRSTPLGTPVAVSEPPPWTTAAWGAAWLYLLYRLVGYLMPPADEPPGGCLVLEAAAVPLVMLAADGLLFGWVLQELRRAWEAPPDGAESIDLVGSVNLWPRAMLACLLTLPARYVATLAFLAWPYVKPWAGTGIQALEYSVLRGPGLIVLQAVGLVLLPVAGVAAWSQLGLLSGTFRLLRAEGARLVAVLAGAGLAIGATTALATVAVLALPPQPWVLGAADSYAHLASLPLGLILLATLIELAEPLARSPRGSVDESPEAAELEALAARIDADVD